MGKIINDSVPNEVMQGYSLVTNCAIGFGIFYSGVISALFLPLKEDGEELLLVNTTWRIVWAWPILNHAIFLSIAFTFFQNPSL